MTRFPSLRHWTIPLAALLTLLLASCGVQEPVSVSAPDDTIAHVLTIDIGADADAAELASAYDAQVLSFHPDAGFAILGLRPGADRMFPQAESNEDALGIAEASGFSAWAGGFSAWAGGVSAWAGGFSAWAGGVDSTNPFPANVGVWTDIGLDVAHASSTLLGAGITVAVIDTGVDVDHMALQGKLAPSSAWYDYVDGDTNPDEASDGYYTGHGTAVAGIILQVAPEATILPLRVLSQYGWGDLSDVVLAIERALDQGADVINLSLGSKQSYAALEQMIAYADSQGVPVIASTGNTGNSVLYPAAYADQYDLLFAVGSISNGKQKSGFSSYGYETSLMTYGEGIASLYLDNGVMTATGTSFAAPFVTGSAALALAEMHGANLSSSYVSYFEELTASLLAKSSDASIYNYNGNSLSGKLGTGSLDVGSFLTLYQIHLGTSGTSTGGLTPVTGPIGTTEPVAW